MRIKLVYFLCYQVAFLFWCFQLHSHFFEFTLADQSSLTITAMLPIFLIRFKRIITVRFVWVLSLILPLCLLPAIRITLPFFSDVWILLYIFLVFTGVSILISKFQPWILLGFLSNLIVWILPFSFHPNQVRYYDFLSKTISTRNGEVDIVNWKNDQWYYYNNSLVISTVDGHIHSETMAHVSLPFYHHPRVLLIGDDFSLTRRQIEKYSCVLTHIPFDGEVYQQMKPLASGASAMNENIFIFLRDNSQLFDVILIDLPDPEHIVFKPFYQSYFYTLCLRSLKSDGMIVTNAGGYYTSEKYYENIEQIFQRLSLETVTLQGLIPTLGHRAWIMASAREIDLQQLSFDVPTDWFDEDAVQLLLSKGKEFYPF